MEMNEKIQKIIVHDEENIKGFFGPYRFLSNFEFCPNGVEFEGLMYMSSEAAYQSAKIANIQDRKRFTTLSALDSKREGRKLDIREDWTDVKDDVMYRVLVSKFTRNGGLKNILLDTGDKYLEETNYWNDQYWGVCEGVGENKLGQTLMKVRAELKESKTEVTALF